MKQVENKRDKFKKEAIEFQHIINDLEHISSSA